MDDILGQAIYDFYLNEKPGKLWIHNQYGAKEEMPLHVYFRGEAEIPLLEKIALDNCKGKVLDIGAGAGSHALILQRKGVEVTALDVSAKAAEVMRLRGVERIEVLDIFEYEEKCFDILLLMMNGVGLVGSVQRLRTFLKRAKELLKDEGRLIFDSSDVAYVYNGRLPEGENYYGEIMYQYEYKKQKTEWFSWLYIDQHLLTELAEDEGWKTEVLCIDEFDQYLATLTRC
jgi:SAM-dependent methyltransferase